VHRPMCASPTSRSVRWVTHDVILSGRHCLARQHRVGNEATSVIFAP
jgi:hypothetical protein